MRYLKVNDKKRECSPRKAKAAINEVMKPPSNDSDSGEDSPSSQRQRPVAMVIMGGYSLKISETCRSIKRRWSDILDIGSNTAPIIIKSSRPPLSFDDSDLLNRKTNKWLKRRNARNIPTLTSFSSDNF